MLSQPNLLKVLAVHVTLGYLFFGVTLTHQLMWWKVCFSAGIINNV
jgi:hypothetical protein